MKLKNRKDAEFDFDEKVEYIRLNEDVKISPKNYQRLLAYLSSRVEEYAAYRSELLCRMADVDRALGGHESKEEQEARERERRKLRKQNDGNELPTAKLNTTLDRLHDALTAIMGILFPQHAFYRVTASPENMQKAHALAKMLNQEAQKFKHYSEISKIVMSALKYNLCGGIVDWAQISGRTFAQADGVVGQSLDTTNGNIIFEGNRIHSLDPFNIGWDMAVNIEDVARDAEYFWQTSRVSLHTFRKRLYGDEDIYGPKEFKTNLENLVDDIHEINEAREDDAFSIEDDFGYLHQYALGCRYHARETYIYNGKNTASQDPKAAAYDWGAWISGKSEHAGTGAFGTAELLEVFISLNPKDFGLSKKNGISTWYFQIVNDVYIINASEIGKGNAPLPVFLATMSDHSDIVDKSPAEMLMPLQEIGEKLISAHFQSILKKLGNGNTFVRKGLVDADKVASNTNGVHEIDPTEHDKPISHHVYQISETPNTERAINDVNVLDTLARAALPTASGKVMTDLDRATKHQSQTVKFENSRLMNHYATLLDSRAFTDMRATMRDNELINREEFDGGLADTVEEGETEPQRLIYSAEELREVELTISNGLLNIDRFAVMSALEAIINFAIQSGERNAFDMVKLLNYYSDYAGVELDLNAFVEQNPLDQLDEETQQILAQAAQTGQLQQIVQQLVQGTAGGT